MCGGCRVVAPHLSRSTAFETFGRNILKPFNTQEPGWLRCCHPRSNCATCAISWRQPSTEASARRGWHLRSRNRPSAAASGIWRMRSASRCSSGSRAGVNLTLAGQRYLSRRREALKQVRGAGEEAVGFGRADEGHLKIRLFSKRTSGFSVQSNRLNPSHAPSISG